MTLNRLYFSILFVLSFSLTFAQNAPANNDPDDAIELSVYVANSCTADQQTTGTWASSTHSGYAFDASTCGADFGITNPSDIWYKVTVPESGSFTLKGDVVGLGETTLFGVLYTLNEGVYTKFYCSSEMGDSSGLTVSNRTAGEVIYVQLISGQELWYGGSLDSSVTTICAYDASSLTSTPTAKPMLSYHNPVGNSLSLESPYSITALSVYDLSGREVLKKAPQQKNLRLNTASLAPGVYLLDVQTTAGAQTVKLIKK